MKLGLIVRGGFDPGGRQGLIPALVAFTRELGRRHDVHVFAAGSRSGAARYRVDGAEVTQLDREDVAAPARGPARWVGAAARLVRLARELDRWFASVQSSGPLDLLHAFWADRTALLAAAEGRRGSIPLVVSVGGGEAVWLPELRYGGAGSLGGRTAMRLALGLADAVTVGSAFALGSLAASVAARARVVPLGVTCEPFAASPDRPPGPPWRLLHVANINPVKDHATLLAAMRQVVDRLGDVRLDCVGEDTLAGAAQRRARELGLGAQVVFRGFLPQEALVDLYRGAHLHLLSSRHESQGVVILEAAAAGLPTVGTRVGLLPTLAELTPAAGRCVPIGDVGALTAAICGLLLDRSTREAMGAAAQRFATAHDVAATVQTFEELYASLRARRE